MRLTFKTSLKHADNDSGGGEVFRSGRELLLLVMGTRELTEHGGFAGSAFRGHRRWFNEFQFAYVENDF